MRDIESKKDMRDYIEDNLMRGISIEDIYQTLLSKGYLKSMINQSYEEVQKKRRSLREEKEKAVQQNNPQPIEIIAEPPKKKSFFGGLFGKK
jgi:hypothetical protein